MINSSSFTTLQDILHVCHPSFLLLLPHQFRRSHGEVKFENYSSMPLQLSLIFNTLLLHINFIGSIRCTRSSLYMMKYALCQTEVFNHPTLAFSFHPWFHANDQHILTSWVSEFINIMKVSQRKNTTDLISGYICLKVIIELPNHINF